MCRQEAWQMGNVDCFEIVGVNSFYFVGHYTTVLEFAILGGGGCSNQILAIVDFIQIPCCNKIKC